MFRVTFASLLAVLTATTLTAQAAWTRLAPPSSPGGRAGHALAFDSARGNTVLFGGSGGAGYQSDTWTFDGATWLQRTATGPQGRYGHVLAHDDARGRTVLFGGLGIGGYFNDTWEWNGQAWSARATAGPSARISAAMAHDPQRGRTVLFGGAGYAPQWTHLQDTWEWNGVTWSLRPSPASPSTRREHALAFDPTGGGILLFGGMGGDGQLKNDTWRWDGSAWQQLQPQASPAPRSAHQMVADLFRSRVVMLGSATDPYVWEWNGTSWLRRVMTSPSARFLLAMAYDSQRRQVVLFSGEHAGTTPDDTWVYATNTPAAVTTIGAGCPGTVGTAVLLPVASTLPWIDDLFTTEVSPVPANGIVFVGTGFVGAPLTLGPLGLTGCTLFVDVVEATLAPASAAGTARRSIQIPNSAALSGVQVAQQALVLDLPRNAAGAVMSSAIRFDVGMR